MDMKEASAMTEASGLPSDLDLGKDSEAKSDVSVGRGGRAEARHARASAPSFSAELRRLTREAPLPSLLMAFLLGVLVARRR
ncbi:hypothetical protein CWO91_39745 [Bradyrhizobium genosp. SA-3]|uniref:hypothetical protein n=1 Tax=Bradyrhizobium genosp. SA-3 TaxID=508868 RepID=UPI001028B49B|nr:hypothetical protein [Bradyrhizobium genosp. SA-3]RZM94010.1 hypothetical protein CWO91_39745 [Bradyrhizobium genosp. SA-3]